MLVAAGSARSPKTALRIEQEHACRYNLLAFFETFANLHPIRELDPHCYGPRLEHVAHRHEHVLVQPGIDYCIAWNGDDVLSSDLEHRGAIQARPERAARIVSRQTNAQRAGAFGERGVDEIHTRGEWRSSRCGEVEFGRHAGAHPGNTRFRHLGEHPHARQVGDRKQRRRGIHRRAHGDPAVHDSAAYQAALKLLDGGAVRDLRIVPGV